MMLGKEMIRSKTMWFYLLLVIFSIFTNMGLGNVLSENIPVFRHERRQKPTRIVALGDANTAVRHYKQSRIGLSIVVNRHRNPVRTQS